MSAIHTPFLGGTGFGGMSDSVADSALARPYVPGSEGVHAEVEQGGETAPDAMAAPAAATATEPVATSEDRAEDEMVADWAQEIIEETRAEEGPESGPASVTGAEVSAQPARAAEPEAIQEFEAMEEPVGEPEGEETEPETESGFPDFLFGGDGDEGAEPRPEAREPTSPADPAGDVPDQTNATSADRASGESGLDAETRERIRALAQELEGADAAEDVIARAFEEAYRKAREEGQG